MKYLFFYLLLLFSVSFAERLSINSTSYTLCYFNEKNLKYDLKCESNKREETISIEESDSSLVWNGVYNVVDSISESDNSEKLSTLAYYVREESTNIQKLYVFSSEYVNIILPAKWKITIYYSSNDENYYSGSGFGVNSHILVTNYHVVEKMKSIIIKIGDSYSHASIKYFDKGLDIAILKVDSIIGACEVYNDIKKVGDDVIAYGYPNIDIQGQSIKATKGIISSKFGYQDNVITYQIDAAIRHGNSGGPLVSDNKVVGVVVSMLENAQNVNFAIKSIFVAAMLKAADIQNTGKLKPTECTYLVFGSNN